MTQSTETPTSLFGALPIPGSYPSWSHTRLHYSAHAYFQRASVGAELQSEFRSAWNAVVYPFIVSDEAAAAFARSVELHGAAPPHPERYLQERDFFHFVVSSVACLEALHYGIYAWGACCQLGNFSLSDENARRDVSAKSTLAAVRALPDAQDVGEALSLVQGARTYEELLNMRRVLFHRGLPGRHISLSLGGPPSRATRYSHFAGEIGPDITPDTTRSRLQWLVESLERLLPAAERWVKRTA